MNRTDSARGRQWERAGVRGALAAGRSGPHHVGRRAGLWVFCFLFHPSNRFALRLKLIVNVRCSSVVPCGKGATNFTLSKARWTDLFNAASPERRSMRAEITWPLLAMVTLTLTVESSSV